MDVAVQYECPYERTTHILVVQNALHVPSMKNNLLLPSMMIEAGLRVNDALKIQVDDPSIDNHCIYFLDNKFQIPLSLWGVFSYFPSINPTDQTLKDNKDIYMLPLNRWDQHKCQQRENILDWQGNMVDRSYRTQVILSNIKEDATMSASVNIGSA